MAGSALPDPVIAATASAWTPASADDRDVVLQQLDRMLAHASFRNSKRYSSLFRYVVERTLRGDRNLKERVLGIEVFGREPGYDTNEDPVVRVTAGEIRRRIAQYYYEAGHDEEIRIDLPPGSYNPLFRLAAQAPGALESSSAFVRNGLLRAPELVEEPTDAGRPTADRDAGTVLPSPSDLPARRFSVAAVIAIAAVVCLVAGALVWNAVSSQTTLQKFWAPVLATKLPVLIAIPDLDSTFSGANATAAPAPTPNTTPASPLAEAMLTLGHDYRRAKVSFGDSVALANVTSLLGSKGADFRIKRSEDASLEDLKAGPVVLIAGGNNHWSLQFGKQLRFTFERDGDSRYVGDADHPSSRQWSVSGPDTAPNQTVDYAIISRVFDATTGGVLVTAAGLHHNATQAAGICLASEDCLRQAGKMAGGDWSKANIEFVIQTTVLGDDPGQPRVVAAQVW